MAISSVVDIAWQLTVVESVAARMQYIESEHFLEAMTKLKALSGSLDGEIEGVRIPKEDRAGLQPEMQLIGDLLEETGIDSDAFRHELRDRLGTGKYTFGRGETVHRSDRCRQAFKRADTLAAEMGSKKTNIGHLFLGLLEDESAVGCKLLVEFGANLAKVADKTRERLRSLPEQKPREPSAPAVGGTPVLDRFGRDLTETARAGKLGPVIGRRQEILNVIQTLARRSKNNPVLIGEAGVGKTAVAEAVAIRAAAGKDPRILGGKRIIELNMSTLVGGTSHRGQFEERLDQIIKECRNHPEIILFIDELHTVIGAGKAEGSIDAANILKPALARGEVRCIGATTVAEYRRYIESDAALERRFEKVLVNEPTREETLEILRGLRPRWEEHHCVSITDKALEAAIDLSVRFDWHHQLPDKAIDLVDKAGARAQVPMLSMQAGQRDAAGLSTELSTHGTLGVVTERGIAEVLSEKIRVPLEIITGQLEGTSRNRFVEMEAAIKQRVIGQDNAVERVCQRLMVAQAGLGQRRGPLGVFLFLGPTGVGKTELARAIASFLFASGEEMIRLDMSEFMEEHSVAKLIGSPPGYIGHQEEGQLTGKLRSRPYSVVLLDEIEKGHPRVFDLFLQVFDEGRLTDAKGRTADARNAIFIMTSNIPADRQIGFRFQGTEDSKKGVLQETKTRFRAEFLNRIDEQIVFHPLSEADIGTILRLILDEIKESLQGKHGKELHFTDAAMGFLIREGYSDEYGVRHLRRAVQKHVELPLSRLIVSDEIAKWQDVLVDAQDEQIILKPSGSETI